ncbi:MAG: M15 family metallopeptidase [Defluviitaleaceae bacterium]|nr:M15 family metallopeptidase [Defluviitaleaceae bacterium]
MQRRRHGKIRPFRAFLVGFVSVLALAAIGYGVFLVFDTFFGSPPIAVTEAEPVDFQIGDAPQQNQEPTEPEYTPELPGNTDTSPDDTDIHIEGVYENGNVVNNSLLPWYLALVNRYNFLPYYFAPTLTAIGGGHYFDARAAQALHDMMDSARYYGLAPMVISSHRSVSRQRTLFDNQVNRQMGTGLEYEEAREAARRVVAYPGSSEHNLGLAVDIVAYHYRNLTASFGQTPEGQWLAQNSHRYGFVLRYPYHKQDITNIIYEPWHFRYVGVDHATRMFEEDMVLEEYVIEFLAGRP